MAGKGLDYRDFRPMRAGDEGTYKGAYVKWSSDLITSRLMINPSTGQIISRRQYDTARLGESYEKHVARKIKEQGYVKQKRKPRKKRAPPKKKKPPKKKAPLKRAPIKKKPPISRPLPRKEKPKRGRSVFQKRADFLMERFLEQISKEYGKEMEWDDLLSHEQALFWDKYHDLAYRPDPPSEDEWIEDYAEFFGDYDEDILDMSYGPTP